MDVEAGGGHVDDEAQLGFVVLARQEFPVEPGDDHGIAVGGGDVDHELFQQIALAGIDADDDAVGVADAHDEGAAAGVRHADEDLRELGGGAAGVRSERDAVAAEDDLLELELGVFAGPNG